MQVKVDILEGLQRKITVEIASEKVEEKVLQGLKKAQKTAKLDGFRKGKVPMKVIQQRYGAAVRQDVLGELIESSYGDAIKQEKLIPAGQPHVHPVSGFAANEPFVYEATLEIVPEFDVKGLDSLTIKKPVSEVGSKDVEAMLDTLRKQAATWKNSEETAVEGDRVMINFVGKIDGKTFEGGSAEDVPVVLGAKQMLPEFEAALFDKKVGDNVVATVNFPEDYHGEDVAGKTAEFNIEVKLVEKPELPEVDAEFVKRFGITEGGRKALEKAIRENMERELESGIRRQINQQVMQHLVDANQVMLPNGMIAQEKERLAHEQNLEKSVPDEEARKKLIDEQLTEPARRRVLLGLIMGKLLEEKQIRPDAKRVEAHIERVAGTYEDPQEVREYYQKNPNALEQIYAQVMEDQLIDQLLENAKVVEEKCSFNDVMQGNIGG
ncbi:MAG: trigger factor [Gammaproteobacteria bacterium]|nr:MAG: trigger factor [Gammaproteobacteria bacterium]